MAIFDIFSKRQKQLRGEIPDVYTYESLPQKLKTQIIYIWFDSLGDKEDYYHQRGKVRSSYTFIVETLCREYGVFSLNDSSDYSRHYLEELVNFFLKENDVEKQLDVVEISFRLINMFTREYDYLYKQNASKVADASIIELNQRFQEHGVGYQYSNNIIIRVDSEYTHSEVIKPALRLLNKKEFAGAQEEFLIAHEHYRKGKSKEALNECLKSFESTMKAICDKRHWEYNKKKATAKELINICFEMNLIPQFWESKFSSLRSLLESSVPTGRNKLSSHGQGSKPKKVPPHIVSYMINMTASSLVFLLKADENIK